MKKNNKEGLNRSMDINAKDVLKRFKTAMGHKNDDQIGSDLEIDGTTVASIRHRGTLSGSVYARMIALCQERNVSTDYIFLGKEDIQKSREKKEDEYVVFPSFSDSVNTKNPSHPEARDTSECIAIPKRFAREGIIAITVHGNAMFDYIPDGSQVLVNTKDKGVISGELYAIYLPTETHYMVRRVLSVDNNKIELISVNPSIPNVMITKGEDTVLGQIVWINTNRLLLKDLKDLMVT